MGNFLHNLTFPLINLNLNNNTSASPPLLNSHRHCREALCAYISLSYAQNINPLDATKKFRCLDSSFHYVVGTFCLPSSPTWAAYSSRQFYGPLLPPAQECNSLQCISFTHHHSQYLPPFLLIYPLVNLPIPERFRIQGPASQIRIPHDRHCQVFLDDF